MNKEDIERIFHRIELDKASDPCGFEFADGYGCTFDNIAMCYDDRLALYDLVKKQQKILQELEIWLEEKYNEIQSPDMWYEAIQDTIKAIQDKINELKEKYK